MAFPPEPELENLFDGLAIDLDYLAQFSWAEVEGILLNSVQWVCECWLEDPDSSYGRSVDEACQFWNAFIKRRDANFKDFLTEGPITPFILSKPVLENHVEKPIEKPAEKQAPAVKDSNVENPVPIEAVATKALIEKSIKNTTVQALTAKLEGWQYQYGMGWMDKNTYGWLQRPEEAPD
ncbi:hypothetical protein SLS62_002302 [Diatrype stigma]|uniref:Uncharacterized protein n=1 Tax=Diatrype stigma TaxID=117547 RepID=A0AAN9YSG8_9PEZI